MTYMNTQEFTLPQSDHDQRLWQLAQLRVAFKVNLGMYVLVNTFLIGVWYFTSRDYFWPIWPMLGWGLGVAIHALRAYGWNGTSLVEQEYRKLKGN